MPTGNPYTDIDFFTRAVSPTRRWATLAVGPNAGGQSIIGRLLPALIAGLLFAAAAGCSGGDEDAPAQLDAPAQQACAELAPIGGDVRRGELEGPELYRKLQDVYNAARTSQNSDVSDAAYRLLSAAIQEDRPATSAALTELQQACALPFT